jgi:hypothetical protein
MKKFRRSRDDGTFALTTLQNPNLEVRSLSQLIAAAETLIAEQESACTPDRPAASAAPSSSGASHTGESSAAPTCLRPAAELASEAPLDPAGPPPPQPRPCRKPLVRGTPRPSPKKTTRHQPRPRAPRRELTDLERHQRKCYICNHPDSEEFDQDFLNWSDPANLIKKYLIVDRRYIYRHAHATGLMERRRFLIRDSLEHLIEKAESVTPSADAIIRAVQACSRINAQGEWVDSPRRVVFSSEVQKHFSSAVQRHSTESRATLELPENLLKLPPAIDLQTKISNRHTPRLENAVTRSKQTTAPGSNRHIFTGLARKIRAFFEA